MSGGEGVRIVHFVPGRVRLKVAAIKGNADRAERMRTDFARIPGVLGIEYNTLTGSVLIHYDGRRLRQEDATVQLKTALREHLPGLDADEILHWLRGPS